MEHEAVSQYDINDRMKAWVGRKCCSTKFPAGFKVTSKKVTSKIEYRGILNCDFVTY